MYYVARTLFPVTAIQNLKKNGASDFFIDFNSENIFGILEGQKLETIIFYFFNFLIFFNSRNSNFQN